MPFDWAQIAAAVLPSLIGGDSGYAGSRGEPLGEMREILLASMLGTPSNKLNTPLGQVASQQMQYALNPSLSPAYRGLVARITQQFNQGQQQAQNRALMGAGPGGSGLGMGTNNAYAAALKGGIANQSLSALSQSLAGLEPALMQQAMGNLLGLWGLGGGGGGYSSQSAYNPAMAANMGNAIASLAQGMGGGDEYVNFANFPSMNDPRSNAEIIAANIKNIMNTRI